MEQGGPLIGKSTHRLEAMELNEFRVRSRSSEALEEFLEYFRFLEETILIALANSDRPVKIESDKNNPILFAVIATSRALSVAKGAMELSLSGHPFEALALTRILGEIAEASQFLVRHPDKIDRFVSGSLKLEKVLKEAKRERPKDIPYAFGRLRGIQSEFAHASATNLVIPVKINSSLLTSPLVVEDLERIEEAAHGIALILLNQYMILRLTLRDALAPLEELASRDSVLFDPKRIRVIVRSEAMSDQQVIEMRDTLSNIADH